MSEAITIEINENGVFLSVPEGTLLEDALAALSERNIQELDEAAVRLAVQAPGELRCVAPVQEDRPARIHIDIPRNSLCVRMAIDPPVGNGNWPQLKDLKVALRAKNVVYGVDEDALKKLLEHRIANEWLEVARGVSAVNGQNGEINYEVELGSNRPLSQDGEGKVDLKELSSITIVEKGQMLATRTPATEGRDGIDIYGKTLKAKSGKDRKLPAGKGTVSSEDGMTLYAEHDGHLVLRGNLLEVLAVYTVSGDVDYSVGNIHFIGAVEIQGAVRDGFEVRTSGDIVVGGVVEGAVIETETNLNVKVGITASGKGAIRAGGGITAGYVDKAIIHAGEDVRVKDAIMHSHVSAGKSILLGVQGGKGQIVGGQIQSGLSVRCVTLGSSMGTRTEVHVGVPPQLAERRSELTSWLNENKSKLQQIDSNVEFLKKLEQAGKIDVEKRTILLKLTKGGFQIRSAIEQYTRELEDIESKLEESRSNSRVHVRDICYPGVIITMRGITYKVREEMRHITFCYDRGEIQPRPYESL
ncbi:MAG: polymerase [Dethiosulfovibrio peptidovorans]|nr:MAG: polymerase [Dethiosulfovibrio peptidovorans]